jgi:hypothetical protein
MKIFCFLISLSSLLLIGCSSTYTVADFASKEKFYEDFNNSAGNKSLKIIMNNDSTINAGNGALISNDSLIFAVPILKEKKISRDDIEEFIYNSYDINIINTIILKNGKSITSDHIRSLPDSSVSYFDYVNTNESLSLNNVKWVCFKNHLLGVPIPLVSGTVIGTGFGILIGYSVSQEGSSESSQNNGGYYTFIGLATIGIVTGGIIGWLNGWTYTYQFNP